MRYGRNRRRSSTIVGGIGGDRIRMSSLSLKGSHGILQTASVGRPVRVRSATGGRTTPPVVDGEARLEDLHVT